MIGWGKGWLTEAAKLVNILPPVDKNGATTASLWVNLKNFKRCTFIVLTGACSGITPPALTINQATDNAATVSKALDFDSGYAWKSLGQSQTTDTDALAALTVTSNAVTAPAATNNSLYAINIRADQLDINNGFGYVNVAIASPGSSACLIAILAVLYDGWTAGAETTLPTVVAG